MTDPLDDLLAKEPYLDDAGFTAQVLDRLPPPRRDLRPLALGLAGLAAGGLAAWGLPGLLGALLQAPELPALGLSPPLLLSLLCSAGALGYAAFRLLGDRG